MTATVLSLKNMGDEHDIFSETLFENVFRKLPENDRESFISESVKSESKMNLVRLEPWLQARSEIAKLNADFRALSPLSSEAPTRTPNARQAGGPSGHRVDKRPFASMERNATGKCELCLLTAHALGRCSRFKNMTIDGRW